MKPRHEYEPLPGYKLHTTGSGYQSHVEPKPGTRRYNLLADLIDGVPEEDRQAYDGDAAQAVRDAAGPRSSYFLHPQLPPIRLIKLHPLACPDLWAHVGDTEPGSYRHICNQKLDKRIGRPV